MLFYAAILRRQKRVSKQRLRALMRKVVMVELVGIYWVKLLM